MSGLVILQGGRALSGSTVAVQQARSGHARTGRAGTGAILEAYELRQLPLRLPSNAYAARSLRQGRNDVPSTSGASVLATGRRRLGAQSRAVTINGTTETPMGGGPSSRAIGAGEGSVTAGATAGVDGALRQTVVATLRVQVPVVRRPTAGALNPACAPRPNQLARRIVLRVEARGRRLGTSLAVTAVACLVAARDESNYRVYGPRPLQGWGPRRRSIFPNNPAWLAQ